MARWGLRLGPLLLCCAVALSSPPARGGSEGAVRGPPPWRPRETTLYAEFEPAQELLVAGRLALDHPQLFAALASAASRRAPVTALVDGAAQCNKARLAVARRSGIRAALPGCLLVGHDTIWIRDYGPLWIRGPAGLVAVDPRYGDGWRHRDDAVPWRLGRLLQLPRRSSALVLEGGNLISNGAGIVVTTDALYAANAGASRWSVRYRLRRLAGAGQLVELEALSGEPTGHVDVFCAFVSRDTALVGSYDPRADPRNARLLDRNAARLARLRVGGAPLRVVRIPMPPHQGAVWPTYLNAIMLNKLLLMPVYPQLDPLGGRAARRLLRRLLRGWDVVGIDATQLVRRGGALRCASLQLPAMAALPRAGALHSTQTLQPLSVSPQGTPDGQPYLQSLRHLAGFPAQRTQR